MNKIKEHNGGSILVCDNLTCGYSGKNGIKHLIKSFSTTVSKGELISLIGVNGAGKSTLLKTLLGLLPALNGKIEINDKNIEEYSPYERAKLIGAALSGHIEEQYISISELVALGRYPYTNMFGRLSPKDLKLVDKYLKLVQLSDKNQRQFYSLSDGEKQKAIIAKILAQETPLILLDEPTAHLDIPNRIHIFHLLKELSVHQQKAILITTHNLELAMELSDKIWLIDNEGVVHEETPEDLSYSGIMGDVFSSDKIIFDKRLMQFTLSKTYKSFALIKGDKEALPLLKNLLSRNTIGITNDKVLSDFEVDVLINPLNITLINKKGKHNFSSFAALQIYLRNQKNE